jgi:hypothetical protein
MASPNPTSSWRTRIRPSRRIALGVGGVAAVILVLALVLRALHPAAFDRRLAIDRTIDASGGRLTRAQAACYVDKARAKVGASYLDPSVSVPAAVGQRLTAIRDDCVGLAGLGVKAPAVSVPGTEAGNQPLRRGQDPALDALWARCAAGSGAACDELFDRSPVGSEYERFALSCGGRTPQMRCAAVYRLR